MANLKKLHLFFLLLFSQLLFAQHVIRGDIKDTQGVHVVFANVLLLKAQDSTMVTGTSSDEQGRFQFEMVDAGSYVLKTSYIGYKDHFVQVDVTADQTLSTIVLEENSEALSEVEILVQKPTVKRQSDRLIFNVEKTALSEGNILEVLRNTPSVLVLDNEIKVKNSAPAVYINDRKVHLSSSELIELLEGTMASNIKSVEVITNPSARYDADSGVVLNIVMSKNLVTGYNGSLYSNFTQGVFPKTNVGTSHYFKSSKFDAFINYSYNSKKVNRGNENIVVYPDEVWSADLNRNTWSESHNLGMNLDFDLNPKSTLGIASNAQFLPYFKYTTRGKTIIEPTADGVGGFDSFNLSRDHRHNIGVDLDYNYQLSDKSKLSLNSHYTNYDYYRNQRVNNDYFNGSGLPINSTFFRTRADQDTNIFTTQLDFSSQASDQMSWELGAKLSSIRTNSGIVHRDLIGGVEIINPTNTNDFDYEEDVYAGYADFTLEADSWNLNLGLRIEQTQINGVSSNGAVNDQDYTEWFPTASFGYSISDKVQTYANYKRSIQRPNYTHLNPFIFYLNDNTIVTGNPNLQPMFNNHFVLGTTIGGVVAIETYYKRYDGNIVELPIQDNDTNVITYTPVNIESTEELGFDVEAYFDITNKWSFYFGNSIYNYNDKGQVLGGNVQRDQWTNYTVVQNDWSFLKDNSLMASLTVIYVGENVQGFQVVDNRWDTFLSIKKTLMKGKGVLSLSVSDLFNKQDYFVTTKFLDQNSTLYSDLDTRYVRVGFRYKFGNTKLTTNQHSTSREERDRLGSN